MKKDYDYKTIEALYEGLRQATDIVTMKGDTIVLTYSDTSVMTITYEDDEFVSKINGELYYNAAEGHYMYPEAIEFAHERRTDLTEIELEDFCILAIDDTGLTYEDYFDRVHRIPFAACAKNYRETTQSNSKTCICPCTDM